MMTTKQALGYAFLAIALSSLIVLAIHLPEIDAWEKAAGYPYGHLCDLYASCGR